MMRRPTAYRGENSETGGSTRALAFGSGIGEQNRSKSETQTQDSVLQLHGAAAYAACQVALPLRTRAHQVANNAAPLRVECFSANGLSRSPVPVVSGGQKARHSGDG